MKLKYDDINVEKSGITEENTFNIEATGKAFKILSDGLYSDKIKAVIRELACNAHDSHIAAGKADVPFEIHLPTPMEPYFSVRDFGLGLNHDDVLQLYTTYFRSTKTESNDYTGALGLGSKSPFNYTDSFSVTSIFDGVKREYTAYIGEHTIPRIAFLAETEVDECNGVEIRLPIKKIDFYDFREKARSVLTYFERLPNSNIDLDIRPHCVEFEHNGNFITSIASTYFENTDSVAVMGNVSYRIATNIIKEYAKGKAESIEDIRFLSYLNMVLHFPLGALEFTPSREELGYTEDTKEKIYNAMLDVLTAYKEKVLAAVISSNTYYSACQRWLSLGEYQRKFFNDVIWTSADGIEMKVATNFKFYFRESTEYCSVFSMVDNNNPRLSMSNIRDSLRIPFHLKYVIVYCDEKTVNRSKIEKLFIDDPELERVFLIRKSTPRKYDANGNVLWDFEISSDIDMNMKYICDAPLKLSTLPKCDIPKQSNVNQPETYTYREFVYKFNTRIDEISWKTQSVDDYESNWENGEPVYYISREDRIAAVINEWHIAACVTLALYEGIFDTYGTIYSFSKKHLKKIKSNKKIKLVNIVPFFKKMIEDNRNKWIEEYKVSRIMSKQPRLMGSLFNIYKKRSKRSARLRELLELDQIFGDLNLKMWKNLKNLKLDRLISAMDYLINVGEIEIEALYPVENVFNNLNKVFPMLQFISYEYKLETDVVLDYIENWKID